MPHAEIRGPVSLVAFHAGFAPRAFREADTVTRAGEAFLSHDARSLLLEVTVVEGFLRQVFFLICTQRENGAMVRLLPRTSPEKTAGVKRSVAWVARWLQSATPSSSVGATNLADWLSPPFPEDAGLPES
jgi:hypothetical protein